MIVVVFLVSVLLAFAIQSYFQRKKYYKFAEDIPSPKSFGFLGHAPYFLGKDEEGSLLIKKLFKIFHENLTQSKIIYRSIKNASSIVS